MWTALILTAHTDKEYVLVSDLKKAVAVGTPKPEGMFVLAPAQNGFCIVDAKWSKCHEILHLSYLYLFSYSFRLMKCPSCMAANVATVAAIEMGMIDHTVMGIAMKSKNPAHLFAVV